VVTDAVGKANGSLMTRNLLRILVKAACSAANYPAPWPNAVTPSLQWFTAARQCTATTAGRYLSGRGMAAWRFRAR
jgi:hypothetical protein